MLVNARVLANGPPQGSAEHTPQIPMLLIGDTGLNRSFWCLRRSGFSVRCRNAGRQHEAATAGSSRPGAFENRDFRLWWLGSLGMNMSLQMLEVAIGWEVYAQHNSPLDLGWIGLAEFVPMFVLAIPAGHLADRLPRRLVFALALVMGAAVGVGLAVLSASAVTSVLPYLALAAGAGVVMATGTPASRAMPPTLVPADLLPSAMTLRSIAGQSAMVLGPALGGVLYGVSCGCWCTCSRRRPCAWLASAAVLHDHRPAERPSRVGRSRSSRRASAAAVSSRPCSSCAGPRFCWARFCSICSPCFSAGPWRCCRSSPRSILHTGPEGLGILHGAAPHGGKSAPSRGSTTYPAAAAAKGPDAACWWWSGSTVRASSCSACPGSSGCR